MNCKEKLLEVRDIHKVYTKEGVPTKALNGITFDVLDNHYIHLTDLGRDVAEKIYERHCFFTYQLIAVGVNPQTAEVDACRMEHAVSDESFQKLKEHAMRGIAAQKIDNTFDNFPVKK